MTDTYESEVRRFHVATGQPAPSVPTMPDAETRALRVRLLLEEVLEYAEASGVRIAAHGPDVRGIRDLLVTPEPDAMPDLSRMAHENTDILVVGFGNMVAMGAPTRECFDEVSQANLRKAPGGKVQRRPDGKVLKPEGWQPADVGAVLARATREALLAGASTCEHDVKPDVDKPGFGRCWVCGESDFPLTDAAAWGDVKCGACKDTGLVPVPHASGLADGPCREPDCDAGKEGLGVRAVLTPLGRYPDSGQRSPEGVGTVPTPSAKGVNPIHPPLSGGAAPEGAAPSRPPAATDALSPNPLGLRDPSLAFGGDGHE